MDKPVLLVAPPVARQVQHPERPLVQEQPVRSRDSIRHCSWNRRYGSRYSNSNGYGSGYSNSDGRSGWYSHSYWRSSRDCAQQQEPQQQAPRVPQQQQQAQLPLLLQWQEQFQQQHQQ